MPSINVDQWSHFGSLSIVVGGLLSAHLLSHKAGVPLENGWPCNGPLLRMAEDLGRRLLPGRSPERRH